MIRKFYDSQATEGGELSKEEIKEVVGKLMNAIEEKFDEDQKKPFQYVVGYYHNDELLGYHADSFCNLTKKKEGGKRYNGENPYNQLAVIRKNLDYTLDMTDEKTEGKIFAKMNLAIKERHFDGLSKEDIQLDAVYLDDTIPPQRFVWAELTDNKQ